MIYHLQFNQNKRTNNDEIMSESILETQWWGNEFISPNLSPNQIITKSSQSEGLPAPQTKKTVKFFNNFADIWQITEENSTCDKFCPPILDHDHFCF